MKNYSKLPSAALAITSLLTAAYSPRAFAGQDANFMLYFFWSYLCTIWVCMSM